ncbi:unnamed protein product [Didymodactylos carnosus]|uniref:Uncharacterized protein n=1 Tax=Didymodactylos carnosus TaxID=1234261 RepID=A0A815P4X5_9BILA|nr:unnamed protein product [Didymodactylos carnosus]CAF4319382.1 unnamed protein product [Didymodactylos carnosus]
MIKKVCTEQEILNGQHLPERDWNEEAEKQQTQDYEENYNDHEVKQENIGSNENVVGDEEYDQDPSDNEEDQHN